MTEVVSNERRVVIIRDHLGVDLLLNLSSARCLAPFMREEQTLGSAAAELKMPASTLAYRIGRFRTAGLLEIVHHRARAGKPIPVYRATSDEYHIPFDAMPPGRRDDFIHGSRRYVLTEFSAAMDRALLAEESSGVRVSSHPVRGMEISFMETEAMANTVSTEWWGKVSLTDDEATDFRNALEDLGKRFGTDQPGPGKKPYLAMFGLVPEGRKR